MYLGCVANSYIKIWVLDLEAPNDLGAYNGLGSMLQVLNYGLLFSSLSTSARFTDRDKSVSLSL